jgi:hypothetical protein
MLRELAAAGEGGRSGALDVEWEGARASFFFVSGQPTHLVFDAADGRRLDGLLALDALVEELPADFQVAPWRHAMVTDDTLHCSANELRELFERRSAASNGRAAGSNGHRAASRSTPEWLRLPPVAADDGEQPSFGDFPRLELGPPLWSAPIAKLVNLPLIVSHLRDTLLVLSGPSCRAAAIVTDGEIAKAVLVSVTVRVLGDAAAAALLSAPRGTLTAYRLDDPQVVAALPLLWPAPPEEAVALVPAGDAEPDAAPAATPEYAHEIEPDAASPEPDTAPDVVLDHTMFTLASPALESAPEAVETAPVEASEATEFIPPRIDVDIDALRIELTEIAVRWLGDDDSAQVADAIVVTRPGVDDFVSTIGAIGAMDIPGHESAIVRAMSREMHYRAAEVLCGV